MPQNIVSVTSGKGDRPELVVLTRADANLRAAGTCTFQASQVV